MDHRTPMRVFIGILPVFAAFTGLAAQQPARWSVAPTPLVTIGQSETDTTTMLAVVVGATRLPNGGLLVGDRGSFALRLFSADGKPLRSFGRKGAGPGEIGYLATLLRCGDSLVTVDIEGRRTSVFSLDGRYVRSFRFGSPQAGRPPYRTACNRGGVFTHYGWEVMSDAKDGIFRPSVPFWLSGPDSAVRRVIGSFPGSERYGRVVDGQLRGTRPLPLGKQTELALADDRVYIGTAEKYEIMVFDLSGRQVATIRKPRANLDVTRDDIAHAREREIAEAGEPRRGAIERSWATMSFPETIPAYAALRVDAASHLWVQDYPRGRSTSVAWSVFDPQGRQVAELALPVHLEVYEIGADYVLGRFMDPDEAIPQVRLYRLIRTTR